jgi:exodeoxyribonuclease V alpha subunit
VVGVMVDFKKAIGKRDHLTHQEERSQEKLAQLLKPKEHETAELTGEITFVYRQASGWGFANMKLDDANVVNITGTLGEIYEGCRVTVHGFWTKHAKYGWQVKIRALEIQLASSLSGVVGWFAHRFPDVGPIRAASLVDTFKDEIWAVIENDWPRLAEAPQIGDKLAEQIHHTYLHYRQERDSYVYLAKIGLGPDAIRKAFELWGGEVQKLVDENPYILMTLPGVGFRYIDRIARNAGVRAVDERRILAGYSYALELIERDGNTCAAAAKIQSVAASNEVLGLSLDTVRKHFDAAMSAGDIISEFGAFFRKETADAEHLIAEQIAALVNR